MTSRAFVALARKELRELAPVWAAAMAAVIATFLGPIPQLRGIGVLAWVVALPALGAMAFGHDLRHRTLEALLVQPVSRAAVLATKLAVLLPLVVSLTGLLWLFEAEPAAQFGGWWFLLPAACAMCLAPWLTLVGRSELAGVAAAGGVPALLWILANGVAAIAYGDANPVGAAALQEAIFTPAVVAALGVGAVGSVGAFLRIQAVGAFEGGAQARSGTRGIEAAHRRRSRRPRSALMALVGKELRLQRLPITVGGLFALFWLGLALAPGAATAAFDLEALRYGTYVLYVGMTVLLVGAVASADERQLGVLPTQLLQPIAAWKQWAVKVGCAAGVCLALVIGLPWVLTVLGFGAAADSFVAPVRNIETGIVVFVLLGLAVSLYVSTLNTGGLKALLFAMGTLGIGAAAVGRSVGIFHFWWGTRLTRWLARAEWMPVWDTSTAWWIYVALRNEWLPAALAASLVVFILALGLRNHASVERASRVVRRQAAQIAAAILLASLAAQLVGSLLDGALLKSQLQQRAERERQKPTAVERP